MPHRGGAGAARIRPQCAGEASAHSDAMKTAREAGEEQQRVVGHGRCFRTNRPRRRAPLRYFLRASRASQMKNPMVKAAKPKNATSCSVLALASENPVSASIASSSAGNGADHVHDEFKTQEHQVDDGDPEDNFNAQHR